MQKDIIYSMLLDGSGIVIMLLMVIPMFPEITAKREVGKGIIYIFNAAIAHSLALFGAEVGFVRILAGLETEIAAPGMISILACEVLAIWFQIKYTLIDQDGVCRLIKRRGMISVGCVAALVLPWVVSLGMESLLPEFAFLGLSRAVSISIFYIIYRDREDKRLEEEARAVAAERSRFLAEQMRPHFIFNALMCIEDLCYTDPEQAAKRLEDFSGFLRGNIEAMTNDDKIPFSKEMEHIRQYIMLEKAGATYDFEVEQNLEVTDFYIPQLTIQPIVENAIKHGAMSRKDHKGKVTISTQMMGNFVRITVEDNGNAGADLTSHQKEHKGIALENVKKRIRILDGTLKEETGEQGTTVTITIPAGRQKQSLTDGLG